jgi:hypothetical protein
VDRLEGKAAAGSVPKILEPTPTIPTGIARCTEYTVLVATPRFTKPYLRHLGVAARQRGDSMASTRPWSSIGPSPVIIGVNVSP